MTEPKKSPKPKRVYTGHTQNKPKTKHRGGRPSQFRFKNTGKGYRQKSSAK